MSFMLPFELADAEVRPAIERAAEGARANGTPFISFFTPKEMLALASEAGFRDAEACISGSSRPALLRWQDRWASPAQQLRGVAARDDVVNRERTANPAVARNISVVPAATSL